MTGKVAAWGLVVLVGVFWGLGEAVDPQCYTSSGTDWTSVTNTLDCCDPKPADLDLKLPFTYDQTIYNSCAYGCGFHNYGGAGYNNDYCSLDLAWNNEELPIASATNGVISHKTSDWSSSIWCGHRVVVQHTTPSGATFYIQYCHMKEPSPLAIGTPVNQGDIIGTVGASGDGDWGNHLHFTVFNGATDCNYDFCINGNCVKPEPMSGCYWTGANSCTSNNGQGSPPVPTPVPVPVPTGGGCRDRYQRGVGINFRSSPSAWDSSNIIAYLNNGNIVVERLDSSLPQGPLGYYYMRVQVLSPWASPNTGYVAVNSAYVSSIGWWSYQGCF
eukprot:CAMPEP_0119118294 /NCGR_PEP_ID=MMETSP1310-20130426/193_1 /TAXON_ID=464262 /ORGANISM="Genus nov. species nov., Strain RCC2339" /LENGTH=328 /DNA_ID=CAMNT_0007107641 /DNA_START=97 /DNA_END=1083 /DNA_ORIENTATION=+